MSEQTTDQGAREARYAEAIEDGLFRMHGLTSSCDHHEEARAVMAVADAEQAELRAEVERAGSDRDSAIRRAATEIRLRDAAEVERGRALRELDEARAEVERLTKVVEAYGRHVCCGPSIAERERSDSAEAELRPLRDALSVAEDTLRALREGMALAEREAGAKALRDAAWALDIPNTEPGTHEDRIGATGAPDWLRDRAAALLAPSPAATTGEAGA